MAVGDILAVGPSDEFRVDSTGDIADSDAGSFFTGTGLKAQMQEVGPFVGVEVTDPGDGGAIPVTQSGVCPLVTAGAETRTLPDPEQSGLLLSLHFLTDGGNCVVTAASAVNGNGDNTITFADVSEVVTLHSLRDGASSYAWRVINTDFGTGALSTV